MSTTLIKLLQRALVGALAAGLVGATLVAPTASAQPVPQTPRVASPTTPDGGGKAPSYYYEYRWLSKAKRAEVSVAWNILSKSVSKDGKTLDYKKANKHDEGKTTIRRKVAATYLWGGKKVTHLSKAEKKKVRTTAPPDRSSSR